MGRYGIMDIFSVAHEFSVSDLTLSLPRLRCLSHISNFSSRIWSKNKEISVFMP